MGFKKLTILTIPYPPTDNKPAAPIIIVVIFTAFLEARSGKTIAVPIWSPNSFPMTKADKKIPQYKIPNPIWKFTTLQASRTAQIPAR